MLQNDPALEGAAYQIWTKEKSPQLLAEGLIDQIGRTVRVFTKDQTDVEFIIGENEWLSAHDDQFTNLENDKTEGAA